MTSSKKWPLLAICSLALAVLTAFLGWHRGSRPRSGDDQPTILEGHRSPLRALAFGPEDATLTSAAGFLTSPREEVELIVWDVTTGRQRISHSGFQGNLSALTLSPDGSTLATAAGDGAIRLWDATSQQERTQLDEHKSAPCALAFSADGNRLASADRENNLMLWDRAGKRLWACSSGHDRFVFALAFAPDGRTLASGGTDVAVRLWDAATGKQRSALSGHATAVSAVAFAPDGRTLATGDLNGVVKLWDLDTEAARVTLPAAGAESTTEKLVEGVTALAFAPDGRTLAVAVDQTVRLWDLATGRLVANLAGHEGKVQCLAYSSDGTLLASGSHNRTVRLWDVTRYRQ
jgi:dipeptidyl aminopeptidase/acylaminoacyl peptidase